MLLWIVWLSLFRFLPQALHHLAFMLKRCSWPSNFDHFYVLCNRCVCMDKFKLQWWSKTIHEPLIKLEIPVLVTDMYYIYVELYKPLITVKQHQIFTKWSFGSDLHNTCQRSALVSWPINRCPVSTQQCAILFLDQKKEKIKNTGKCSKIKQNTTSKESVKLCFSLILLVFFLQQKP